MTEGGVHNLPGDMVVADLGEVVVTFVTSQKAALQYTTAHISVKLKQAEDDGGRSSNSAVLRTALTS